MAIATTVMASDGPPVAERLGRWRADTPGCAARNHLNNAGAGLMPRGVADAIRDHVDLEAQIGGYEAADARARELQAVYTDVATLVGADDRNIAITASATAAFLQALAVFDFEPGDVIVTSRADYTSYQIQYLALHQRLGVRIVHAEDLPEGGIDPDHLRETLRREPVRLVSVSWMPTHGGLIQDVHAVGEACEAAGVPFHVDACQAIGQLPIDLATLRCDYLSATGRKFLRGPRGTGFLFASDRALHRGDFPLTVDMRGAEWVSPSEFRIAPTARRFEDWEFPYALVLGLGAAVRYALEQGVEGTGRRAIDLAAYMRGALAAIDGIRLLDRGEFRSAIVTFDHSTVPAETIVSELARRRINVVLTRRWYGMLDFPARGVNTAVRASPHYYNTVEEIDALVEVVRRLAAPRGA